MRLPGPAHGDRGGGAGRRGGCRPDRLWDDRRAAVLFRRHPPPGRLLDVGGHRLHVQCSGAGAPAVIFEAALGGSSVDWYAVQPEVSRFTRACAYDRAGAGWSEAGPLPRDPLRSAEELHTLLGNAGVTPPYVLVGHSYGGYVVRVFAEPLRERRSPAWSWSISRRRRCFSARPRSRPDGTDGARLSLGQAARRLRRPAAPRGQHDLRAVHDSPHRRRLLSGAEVSGRQLWRGAGNAGRGAGAGAPAGSFGALPLAVVTAGKREYMDEDSWRTWQEIQRGLPALWTRSTQLFANQAATTFSSASPRSWSQPFVAWSTTPANRLPRRPHGRRRRDRRVAAPAQWLTSGW